jgi:hypothetical protein
MLYRQPERPGRLGDGRVRTLLTRAVGVAGHAGFIQPILTQAVEQEGGEIPLRCHCRVNCRCLKARHAEFLRFANPVERYRGCGAPGTPGVRMPALPGEVRGLAQCRTGRHDRASVAGEDH